MADTVIFFLNGDEVFTMYDVDIPPLGAIVTTETDPYEKPGRTFDSGDIERMCRLNGQFFRVIGHTINYRRQFVRGSTASADGFKFNATVEVSVERSDGHVSPETD